MVWRNIRLGVYDPYRSRRFANPVSARPFVLPLSTRVRGETVWKLPQRTPYRMSWWHLVPGSGLTSFHLAALGVSIRRQSRFSTQSLEGEFCEVRLSRILRTSLNRACFSFLVR